MIVLNSDFKKVFSDLPINYRLLWIWSLVFGLMNAMLEITISIFIGAALAAITSSGTGKQDIPLFGSIEIKSLIAVLVIVIFTKFVMNFSEVNVRAKATTNSISYYSSQIVDTLLNSGTIRKSNSSDLHVSVIDDTNNTFRLYFFSAFSLFTDFLAFISLSSIAIYAEPKLTLAFGIILATLVAPIIIWVNQSQIKLSTRLQSSSNSIYNLIKQTIEIRNEILLYKKVPEFVDIFSKLRKDKANLESESLKKSNYPRMAIEISFLLSICGFTYITSSNEFNGNQDTYFYVFVFCILRLVPIFGRVTSNYTLLKAGVPSLRSIANLLPNENSKTNGRISTLDLTQFEIEIVMDAIAFQFEDASEPRIRDVNLSISKGEKVVILGASGAGKTTLLEILLGLRAPTAGQLRIDERTISGSIRWLPFVAYVSQKYEVYDHSLRQAITFDFNTDVIDIDKFQKIANILSLDQDTLDRVQDENLTSKFNQNLSGGQLQRVAIARALYSKSEFIVLDEATSNLDSRTSEKLIKHLLGSDRTVVLVTHKISEIQGFDKLVRIKNGQVSVEKK